jgi:serine phosphatase RsbU (regulator of sigma subunit)
MPVPPRRKTSYTGAIGDPIVRFAAELARAVQFHRLYPPEHPYVKQAADVAFAACEVALNKQNPFTFGATNAGFFIEGEVVPDIPTVVEELARAFLHLNVHSLTITRGITSSEIKGFVVRFGQLENDAIHGTMAEGAIERLGRESAHIEINTYSYEKVLAKEGDLFRKVKDVAAETGEDEIDLLDMLLERGGSDMGGAGGRQLSDAVHANPGQVASLLVKGLQETIEAAGMNVDDLMQSGGILETDTPAGDVEGLGELQERMLGFFDKISSAMTVHKNAGMGDVKNAIGAIVSFLPPSSQKLLFGRELQEGEEAQLSSLLGALPIESRSALLFNEMLAGEGSAEQLREDLSTMARRGTELAGIVDRISEQARKLGTQESLEKIISRLSGALQSGIRSEALLRGTIVVVDPDSDTCMDYQAKLSKEGFRVLSFTDGKKALEEIMRSTPDLLVTEIKMHGISGIEIMRTLRRMPEIVPVIIATGYPTFGEDFEVATYPKHAFFIKPVDTEVFVKKVNEFLPEKTEEKFDLQVEGKVLVDTEELETAQEVQQSLLPDALPEIDGFDISVDYSPCREVGGDYYDVLPASNDTWAFVVADVSGKGVPAAMVMVLVRSLVHISLPSNESPRDGIVELNRLLSKEIRQGLFVSGIYARINPKARTVSICSAGQCPAVMWMPGRDKPEVTLLKHTGVVLGLGDTSYFREGTKEQVLQLEPGSGIMIYTDGVIEAMNLKRKEFGTERLMRVVSNSAHMSGAEMNKALRAALNAFSQGKPQHDDITILTIKCTK